MTEQELLQEALEWREHISILILAGYYSDQDLLRKRLATIDWLIKQAKRVEELEKELEQVKVAYDDRVFDIETLQEENKRYKQALEFYADEETYETKFATDTDGIYDPFTLIELDEGKKARQALEGEGK